MGYNFLTHAQGGAVDAILAATGYSVFLILKGPEALLCLIAFSYRIDIRTAAA